MKDTPERYGSISRLFHWLMAGLVGLQLLKLTGYINEGEHWIGDHVLPWHASVGALLLLLVLLRLGWVLRQRGQRPVQTGSMAAAARLVHFLLYVGLVLLPLTGMARLLGLGYGLKVFGLQLVAPSGTETDWLIGFSQLHVPAVWLFTALIIGHTGAALVKHFIVGDDTLRRMAGEPEGARNSSGGSMPLGGA